LARKKRTRISPLVMATQRIHQMSKGGEGGGGMTGFMGWGND
jgi:hypothetical protein